MPKSRKWDGHDIAVKRTHTNPEVIELAGGIKLTAPAKRRKISKIDEKRCKVNQKLSASCERCKNFRRAILWKSQHRRVKKQRRYERLAVPILYEEIYKGKRGLEVQVPTSASQLYELAQNLEKLLELRNTVIDVIRSLPSMKGSDGPSEFNDKDEENLHTFVL